MHLLGFINNMTDLFLFMGQFMIQ